MNDTQFSTMNPEDFRFAQRTDKIRDKKPETKPIGYFRDAWRRFKKNKASIVALCIIVFLILFSLIVPLFSQYDMSFSDPVYRNKIPKNSVLAHIGIATGVYEKELNTRAFEYYSAIGIGASYDKATDTEDNTQGIGSEYAAIRSIAGETIDRTVVKMDAYLEIGFRYISVTQTEYDSILRFEEESGLQVIYPMVDIYSSAVADKEDANYWFKVDDRGRAVTDANGNLEDLYMRDENGDIVYSVSRDVSGKTIRVLYYNYFIYQNGFEPEFLFGTNSVGQDIMIRLA